MPDTGLKSRHSAVRLAAFIAGVVLGVALVEWLKQGLED